MSDINDINQSITSMTDDELFAKIKSLRTARRVPTAIPRHAKKAKKPADTKKLTSALTPGQLAELIAELEA